MTSGRQLILRSLRLSWWIWGFPLGLGVALGIGSVMAHLVL